MVSRLRIFVTSTRMFGTIVGIAGLAFFVGVTLGSPAQSGDAHRTVWDGVYSTEQAEAGAALYDEYCTRCHLSNLSGGGSDPPLAGDKWMENWREDNLGTLFFKIRTTMPRRQPKTLTDDEALQAVSYILKENGFPAGDKALDVAALDGIQIELEEGPKPLPNYALIEVVGCLTQERNQWSLTKVAQARRSRDIGEVDIAEQLKAAAARPLGEQSFRLQNLILLGDFDPEVHKGQKMLAKGALIRRSSGEMVSVTELEMVSETCGQ